ncbi:MAG: hypothetical protein ACREEP_08745 [Dongiaceae bacterium]
MDLPRNPSTTSTLDRKPALHLIGSPMLRHERRISARGTMRSFDGFDRWGVERGKQMAGAIWTEDAATGRSGRPDASRNGLIVHPEGLRHA